MVTAALSLLGLLISIYLWFWKLGFMGPMVCATGGCETVQLSEYAVLFGLPVAFLGVLGFAATLAVSLVGIQGRWAERPEPTFLLLAMSVVGVCFAAYLTYIEAVKIHAWCQWCVACAVLILGIFATSIAATLARPKESSAV
jgi:uncharacterized membrane protein